MTERLLPNGLQPGRTTPSFTRDTVPAALRSAHHTTVWAELMVEQGAVLFVEEDPSWQTQVTAGHSQVIVPNRKHHVEPAADAVFHVQFYVDPEASTAD